MEKYEDIITRAKLSVLIDKQDPKYMDLKHVIARNNALEETKTALLKEGLTFDQDTVVGMFVFAAYVSSIVEQVDSDPQYAALGINSSEMVHQLALVIRDLLLETFDDVPF